MKNWKWLSIALVLVVMVGTERVRGKVSRRADHLHYSVQSRRPIGCGGSTAATHLEKLLGVPIVVNYVPGAGGGLAWTKFAKAKPDGYSVCGINVPHIILQPLAQADIAFKTDDLKPLCMFESTPIGLAVKEGSKHQQCEAVHRIRQGQPRERSRSAYPGKLSGHHLAALQFMKLTDTKLTLVTFTGAHRK